MEDGKDKVSLNFGGLPYMSNTEISPTDVERNPKEQSEGSVNSRRTRKSAPMGLLAEFLTAVMSKDYENALNYCKLILQYEPENETVKEFYPLIQEKLHLQLDEKEGNNSLGHGSGVKNSSALKSSSSSSGSEVTSNESDEDQSDSKSGSKSSSTSVTETTSTSSITQSDENGILL